MSTDLTELTFSETGNNINVVYTEGNIEADEFEFQPSGVMVTKTVSTTKTTTFIPYSNILTISQTESV